MIPKNKQLNNGYSIPLIGYGTFPQKESLVSNIPLAIKIGYRMVDCSDNYRNEEFIGRGLKETDTSNIVVVTKFSQPFRTHELETCFEESYQKLGRINVYLLHWPFPFLWKRQWRKMEDLYLSGKCDAIGVCNFDLGYLKELLSFCRVKPAINQFERHPIYQQRELCEFCHNNDIAVMSYSPVARMDKTLHESAIMKQISEKYKKTVSQVILRWDIDTNCIPIPASSSLNHIKENWDLYDFSLDEKDVEEINNLEIGKRIRFNPRTRFSFRKKVKLFMYRCKLMFID